MFLFFVWLSLLLVATKANGSNIAVNFADDDSRETFLGGQLIGPINTNSKYWNSSIDWDSDSLKAGRINDLIDNSGVQTSATVAWKSQNTWRIDNEPSTTDNQKLSRNYPLTETAPTSDEHDLRGHRAVSFLARLKDTSHLAN